MCYLPLLGSAADGIFFILGLYRCMYRYELQLTIKHALSLQAVTAAAAMNDVGSWALVSFQATFYSRVYELGPEVYAPALAAILPIGGVIGGVGGGLAGDWLSRNGGRAWLTAGACLALRLRMHACKHAASTAGPLSTVAHLCCMLLPCLGSCI